MPSETEDDACLCGHSLSTGHSNLGVCQKIMSDGEWCQCM